MNYSFGFLESQNIAPVWDGEGGTGFRENPDDANWAEMLDKYLNGQLGSQGGPTFSVAISKGWASHGCHGQCRIQGLAATILESSARMDRRLPNRWKSSSRFCFTPRKKAKGAINKAPFITTPEARFQSSLSPDPYDGSYDLSDPQSFNRYAYTNSNPLTFIDPRGMQYEEFLSWPQIEAGPGTSWAALSFNGSLGAFLGSPALAFFSNPVTGIVAGAALGIAEIGHLAGWWGGPQFHGSLQPRPSAPTTGSNCSANPASAAQYAAATAEVGAMTSQFVYGLGPDNLTYGSNSATSRVMGQSGPVQEVLNTYYMTGQTSGLYTFGGPGFVSAGFNPVAQFVGSFRWSISGGNLSLTNTTSFRSLTYDLGPQWQRGSFTTPMGNTHQTYNISVTCQ